MSLEKLQEYEKIRLELCELFGLLEKSRFVDMTKYFWRESHGQVWWSVNFPVVSLKQEYVMYDDGSSYLDIIQKDNFTLFTSASSEYDVEDFATYLIFDNLKEIKI